MQMFSSQIQQDERRNEDERKESMEHWVHGNEFVARSEEGREGRGHGLMMKKMKRTTVMQM